MVRISSKRMVQVVRDLRDVVDRETALPVPHFSPSTKIGTAAARSVFRGRSGLALRLTLQERLQRCRRNSPFDTGQLRPRGSAAGCTARGRWTPHGAPSERPPRASGQRVRSAQRAKFRPPYPRSRARPAPTWRVPASPGAPGEGDPRASSRGTGPGTPVDPDRPPAGSAE